MIFKHCDPRPSRAEIDDAEKSTKISAFWGHLSVLLRSNFERKSKIGLKPKKSSVVLLSFDESLHLMLFQSLAQECSYIFGIISKVTY